MAVCPLRGVINGGKLSQDGVPAAQTSPADSITTAQARAPPSNQLDRISFLLSAAV
ncbi:hypothetical protein [Sorangium sp. So ce1335]|uniref:hypothetical protein n=1 Tax=Sorangium sp. So ce1335 TaxID=3133335 RepID=UPI003F5EE49B